MLKMTKTTRTAALQVMMLLACVYASTAVASATGATGGAVDLTGTTTQINSFLGLLTGPVAKVVAVISILIGAGMMIQGREMGENFQKIGTVVVTVAVLVFMGGWIGGIQGAHI